MDKDKSKIKKFIKKVLEENIILSEIEITEEKPTKEVFHDLGDQKQYAFQTKNGFIYHLSIIKTYIRLTDADVIKTYNGLPEKDGSYEFNALNFFASGDNPNDKESFKKTTGKNEPATLMGNIVWLILDFIKRYPNEKYFIFSADDRRMRLYSNIFDNLKDVFVIFPKNKYDSGYEHDQVLLIKK